MTTLHIAALALLALALIVLLSLPISRIRAFCAIFAAFAMVALITMPAHAQGTTISLGEVVAPWKDALLALLGTVVSAIVAWVAARITKWTGVQIEQAHQNTIQQVMTNAAGQFAMKLGPALNSAKIDLKSPELADAVRYALENAPDAIAYFGLCLDQIAEKILAKLGVLTAAAPTVSPQVVSDAVPAVTPQSAPSAWVA